MPPRRKSQNSNAQQKHQLETPQQQEVAREDATPANEATATTTDVYATHKYLLYFNDVETEQRYFDFQYVDCSFIPGKMFSLMWGAVSILSFVVFTEPFSNGAEYTKESFSSPWWAGTYVYSVVVILLWVGMFVDALRPYREIMHLIQIFAGWPSLILILVYTKRPEAFTYAIIFGCMHFCMVIAQCRMYRSLFFVSVWPLICLFATTYSIPDYWDTHTKIEMLYWGIIFFPLLLLSFLERQTRMSFVERERAVATIADIEHKTVVTQRMIANFFPRTPTLDLLLCDDGPRSKSYTNAVLVITDIAGFTAFTARSNPSDVIEMLTDMFRSFDVAAQTYNVEKIATIGDSYCGTVFPTNTGSDASRCVAAIRFSCSTFNFAGCGLELRVGVHIGDVVGVFVGCAPPKFDLFGPGIDHARIMEEQGMASKVHISQCMMDCVGLDRFTEYPRTDYGCVCESWGGDMSMRSSGLELDDEDLERMSTQDDDNAKEQLDSKQIVKSLCMLSGVLPPAEAHDDGTASTLFVPTATEGTANSRKSKSSIRLEEGDEDVDEDVFDFNPFFLTFNHASVEKRYQQDMANNGINYFCARLFAVASIALLVIQLNLQCTTDQDQGVTSAMLAIVVGTGAYVQILGTNHQYHAPITFIGYNVIFVLAILGLTAECGGLEKRAKYVGDTAGCFLANAIFASQYCLGTKLVYRFGLTLVSCTLCIVCFVIRGYTIGDGVALVDPFPICGFAFLIMSFFPDYSLRSAFHTKMRLRRLQSEAKSRGAAMATSAMSVMLPTFVTEKIVSLARGNKRSEDISDTATAYSSRHSQDGGGLGDIDFNSVAATWEYPHAVMMFAKFHSDDPEFTPDAINLTVQAIEDIIKTFGVMKVKTIGSTVMFVTDIDDERTRQEQVTGIVDAAIMLRDTLFTSTSLTNLVYRVGVHCGPCFGAVIGGNGAIFDLFGDTVNTSSRMCSNASPNKIQLSAAAAALLVPRIAEAVTRGAPVVMKGKGEMEVFTVNDQIPSDSQPPSLVDNLSVHTATTPHHSPSIILGGPAVTSNAIETWRAMYGKDSLSTTIFSD